MTYRSIYLENHITFYKWLLPVHLLPRDTINKITIIISIWNNIIKITRYTLQLHIAIQYFKLQNTVWRENESKYNIFLWNYIVMKVLRQWYAMHFKSISRKTKENRVMTRWNQLIAVSPMTCHKQMKLNLQIKRVTCRQNHTTCHTCTQLLQDCDKNFHCYHRTKPTDNSTGSVALW